MKRDMELFRSLLLKIEDEGNPTLREMPEIEGRERDEVGEHIRMGVEAGIIDAIDARSFDGPNYFELRLTWNGHEFLDATRDPEIWEKTKAGAAKVGSTSMKLMFEIATGYAKAELSRLGIPML